MFNIRRYFRDKYWKYRDAFTLGALDAFNWVHKNKEDKYSQAISNAFKNTDVRYIITSYDRNYRLPISLENIRWNRKVARQLESYLTKQFDIELERIKENELYEDLLSKRSSIRA